MELCLICLNLIEIELYLCLRNIKEIEDIILEYHMLLVDLLG